MIPISLVGSQGGGVKTHARAQHWLLSLGEVTLKGVYVSHGAQMPSFVPCEPVKRELSSYKCREP